jgi:hypothetical protein
MQPQGINIINMFVLGIFTHKAKKLLVFVKKIHHAFSYESCAGCAIQKLHLAVLVAIPKSQFHQHFMSTFCAKILLPKNYKPKL